MAALVLATCIFFTCHERATALQYGNNIAFVVDRCDGGFDCQDVVLVTVDLSNKTATLAKGATINGHTTSGGSSRLYGYEFKSKEGVVYLNDEPLQFEYRSGRKVALRPDNGIVLESRDSYVYVYSENCPACSNIVSALTSVERPTFEAIVVDKATKRAQLIEGPSAVDCDECVTASACKAGKLGRISVGRLVVTAKFCESNPTVEVIYGDRRQNANERDASVSN